MIYRTVLIVVGILLFLMPYSGLPSDVRDLVIQTLSVLVIISAFLLTFSLRQRRILTRVERSEAEYE